MTASALISESDWLRLRAALRRMDEISLDLEHADLNETKDGTEDDRL